jgi:hypothetical protein
MTTECSTKSQIVPSTTSEDFVDPRADPRPPFGGPTRQPAEDAADVADLSRLCAAGRIYEVERWIHDGRPIHALSYRPRGGQKRIKSPLEIAIETKQHDLAVLLLCNGFPPDGDGESLLIRTLEERQFEFFELLLSWGADPLLVDPSTVLDTYDADLYERFWQLGLDLTSNHSLARVLARKSSNQPAYGWARRHREEPRVARQLAIALLEAVVENRERAVGLLMWAGADPRKPVPDLRFSREEVDADDDWSTAMVYAVMYGHGHLLKSLKPHPERDDFDKLWSWVCDEAALDYLAKRGKPTDWSRVLTRNLEQTLHRYAGGDIARKCVEKLTVEYSARLTTMSPESMSYFRRELLKCDDDSRSRWVLRWLSYPETCEPALFEELTRTTAVRNKLNSLHIRDARYRY